MGRRGAPPWRGIAVAATCVVALVLIDIMSYWAVTRWGDKSNSAIHEEVTPLSEGAYELGDDVPTADVMNEAREDEEEGRRHSSSAHKEQLHGRGPGDSEGSGVDVDDEDVNIIRAPSRSVWGNKAAGFKKRALGGRFGGAAGAGWGEGKNSAKFAPAKFTREDADAAAEAMLAPSQGLGDGGGRGGGGAGVGALEERRRARNEEAIEQLSRHIWLGGGKYRFQTSPVRTRREEEPGNFAEVDEGAGRGRGSVGLGEETPGCGMPVELEKSNPHAKLVTCAGLSMDDIAVGVLHRTGLVMQPSDNVKYMMRVAHLNHLAAKEASAGDSAEAIRAAVAGGAKISNPYGRRRLLAANSTGRGEGGGGRRLQAWRRMGRNVDLSDNAAPSMSMDSLSIGKKPKRLPWDPELETVSGRARANTGVASVYTSRGRGSGATSMEALKITPPATSNARLDAMHSTWLMHVNNKMVFGKAAGAKPADYVTLAHKLVQVFPGKKFYLLVHDDTYVYVHNLLCQLAKKDPSKALYIGMSHCDGPNFKCRSGPVVFPKSDGSQKNHLGGWVNGGAGVVLTRKMVENMKPGECATHYKENWPYLVAASDVVLACCVQDGMGQKMHMPGFTPGRPGFSECGCDFSDRPEVDKSCTLKPDARADLRSTFHHVSPDDMRALFRTEMRDSQSHYARATKYRQARAVKLYCGEGILGSMQ